MRRERSHSDLSDLLSDFLRVFHSNYFYSEVGIFVNCLSVQWFSGKIQRCHRWAPSSILGWTIAIHSSCVFCMDRLLLLLGVLSTWSLVGQCCSSSGTLTQPLFPFPFSQDSQDLLRMNQISCHPGWTALARGFHIIPRCTLITHKLAPSY